jgi:hypothetical protein
MREHLAQRALRHSVLCTYSHNLSPHLVEPFVFSNVPSHRLARRRYWVVFALFGMLYDIVMMGPSFMTSYVWEGGAEFRLYKDDLVVYGRR